MSDSETVNETTPSEISPSKITPEIGPSKITPEVVVDDKIMFLIRVDGEPMAFADTEREAELIIDSIGASEQRRLEDEWTEVYRSDTANNKEVTISIRKLGRMYNGSIAQATKIDFIKLSHAVLIKNRHELTDSVTDEVEEESSSDEEDSEGEEDNEEGEYHVE